MKLRIGNRGPSEKVEIGLGRGYRDARPRQVGIDRQIEPWWPALDPAQHQMLDRVKADGTAGNRLPDTGQHVLAAEHLQQPQHLDKLTFAALGHAGFDQATQCGEFLRQLPADQGSRLVQSSDLLFQQCQVMLRVEDEILALIDEHSAQSLATLSGPKSAADPAMPARTAGSAVRPDVPSTPA